MWQSLNANGFNILETIPSPGVWQDSIFEFTVFSAQCQADFGKYRHTLGAN
jgi:hypothetical protein